MAPLLDGVPDSKVTDLKPLLTVIEPMLPTMRANERLPFLNIYFLFNLFSPNDQRTPNLDAIWKRFGMELQLPSVESLLMHLVQYKTPHWPIADHEAKHEEYFRERDRKKGLRVPRSLEMCLTLMLAERYRADGDEEAARHFIAFAVENRPGYASLLELEADFAPEQPIDWRDEVTRRSDSTAPDEHAH